MDSPCSVLIVDDDPINRGLFALRLEELGCRCDVAEDGVAGQRAVEQRPYDMIFTDYRMPRLDGMGLAAWIRRKEMDSGRRSVIIALTAQDDPETVEKCMSSGMDDFVGKADGFSGLKLLVEKWRDGPGHPALREVAEHGGQELPRELLRSFVERTEADIRSLRDAIGTSDRQQTEALLHRLKGKAGTFGAAGLAAVVRELDESFSLSGERFERWDLFDQALGELSQFGQSVLPPLSNA